jgi:hypothetical protein
VCDKCCAGEQDAQRKALINQKVKEYRYICSRHESSWHDFVSRARSEELKQKVLKKEVTERMAKLGVGTLPSVSFVLRISYNIR